MSMRVESIPLLVVLGAALAGCGGSSQPAPYPRQGYYGTPGQWTPGQWGPQGQGQPPTPFLPPPIYRPVNVPALLAIQGRVPCAPKEVAPGTWATFDCGPFQDLA